eukprot:s8749_g2.t1
MLGWLCARTSRCFIRQPCSTTGPACASLFAAWASYEAALLWGSVLEIQHVPPVPADVLDALPPGIPPIRVVPCVDMGCARCREGRGGYQFPFLGTFSRRSVLVAPGTSPSDAWEQHHANASGTEVNGPPSRSRPTDRPVQHARHQRHPRGVTPNQLWRLWRAWHQGERLRKEPGWFTPVPSREAGVPLRCRVFIVHCGCCSAVSRRAWKFYPLLVLGVAALLPCAAADVTALFAGDCLAGCTCCASVVAGQLFVARAVASGSFSLLPGRYCGAAASGRQPQPLPLAIYMVLGLGCGR